MIKKLQLGVISAGVATIEKYSLVTFPLPVPIPSLCLCRLRQWFIQSICMHGKTLVGAHINIC